jgi:hypothetical protein
VSPARAEILVQELADQAGATAVVVRDHEREILSTGRPSATVDCRSIRKPPLGALFGRHVADGRIDLDTTLADLGIDVEILREKSVLRHPSTRIAR